MEKKKPAQKVIGKKKGRKDGTGARRTPQPSTDTLLARREEELKKRNREISELQDQQTATGEILGVIASSPTQLQPVLDVIAERAAKICGAEACQIRLIEGDHLVVASNYGDDRQFSVGSIVALSREAVSGRAVLDRKTIHIHDLWEPIIAEEYPIVVETARRTGDRTWLVTPLLREGVAVGTIHIRRYRVQPFTEKQISQLKIFADQAVIAIENVRLFTETQRLLKETEQRNAELAILNSVGEAMAKTLDVKTVTKIVGDKVRDIFNADQMGILLFDPQVNMIHVLYGYDKAHDRYLDETAIKPLPLGKGLTSKVIKLRQPLLLSTREEQDAHSHYMPPELVGQIKMSESWLGVPIIVEEEVLGVVFVEDYRDHAYVESHLRLLQTLSTNMGVAIQNARLFDETQQRNAELAIINSVQQGLASKLDMHEIYELVGSKILEIFNADAVAFTIYDSVADCLEFPYIFDHGERYYPDPVSGARLDDRFSKINDPLLFRSHRELQTFMAETGAQNLGGETQDNSHIFLPIRLGEQFIGSISIAKLAEDAFSNSDVRLLQTLTASMSVALENARLMEQEKLFRKALQRELEIGREIQTGFLPEVLPQIKGWEIAASLMSAREVAGDFYDAFELPDGTIGLVIADVCDKGVGAALFMTLFRSLIRAASNLDYFEQIDSVNAPHSTTERLQRAISLTNNYIAETHGESGMFATLFFGILDPRDGMLTYINGGHEPPLIIRSGDAREILSKTGPAVGAISNCSFEIRETKLGIGDTLFAFTDGVPDCKDPHGEFFGRERLIDDLHRVNGSAHETVAMIASELHRYISGATQFDDITLLAVMREI